MPRPAPAELSERLHALDGLRATLMLLGIPFHASLVWGESAVLDKGGDFLHLWRMPAFFVLAGFFAGLLVRRRGAGPWLADRARRLGLPLLFGVLVVNSLQLAALARAEDAGGGGAWNRWLALVSEPGRNWLLHLWFLLFLLVYCAVIAAAASDRVRPAVAKFLLPIRRVAERSRAGGPVVALALVAVVSCGVLFWELSGVPEATGHAFEPDFVLYAGFVAVGLVLASSHELVRGLVTSRPAHFVPVVVIGTALYYAVDNLWAAGSAPAVVLRAATALLAGTAWSFALWWLAHRVFRRRNRFVTYLVDASLVVYLVHHLAVMVIGLLLLSEGVSAVPGFPLLVVLVTGSSFLVYEVVNRVPVLRLLATGRGARGTTLSEVWAARGRSSDEPVVPAVAAP